MSSAIHSTGYGSVHRWVRGITRGYDADSRPPPIEFRFTAYHCSNCLAQFIHYYCVRSDIFEAMQAASVPARCYDHLHPEGGRDAQSSSQQPD